MVFRCVRKTYYSQYHRLFRSGEEIVLDYDPTESRVPGEKPENRHFIKVAGDDPLPERAEPTIDDLSKDQLITKAREQGAEGGLTRLSVRELKDLITGTEDKGNSESYNPANPPPPPPPVR
jgi:hypothetical protein